MKSHNTIENKFKSYYTSILILLILSVSVYFVVQTALFITNETIERWKLILMSISLLIGAMWMLMLAVCFLFTSYNQCRGGHRISPIDAASSSEMMRLISQLLQRIAYSPILSCIYYSSLVIMQTIVVGSCGSSNYHCDEFANDQLPLHSTLALLIIPFVLMTCHSNSISYHQLLIIGSITIVTLLCCLTTVSPSIILPVTAMNLIQYLGIGQLHVHHDINIVMNEEQNHDTEKSSHTSTRELSTNGNDYASIRNFSMKQTGAEMRRMIGNVAHDLKTPLSSLTSGIDYIKMLLDDLKATIGDSSADPLQKHMEIVETIESHVNNMESTSCFMAMAINRCIDFTKTTTHVKLRPMLETINLPEVVDLPIRIMRDMQTKMKIVLKVDAIIHQYLITDKHWLQENLLCLLSNAVKYSHRGKITVRLSIRSRENVKQRNDSLSHRSDHSEASVTSCSGYSSEYECIAEDADALPSKLCAHLTISGSMSNEYSEHIDDISQHDVRDLSPRVSNLFLLVEVIDTGIGVSDEVAANLFNPFKQAQKLAGGTGLGLYSLSKRMDALGGLYGAYGRKDDHQGSVFWFALPYRPDFSIAMNDSNRINKIIIDDRNSESMTDTLQKQQSDSSNVVKSLADLRPAENLIIPSAETKASDNERPTLIPITPRDSVVRRKSVVNIDSSAVNPAQPLILVVDDTLSILKMTSTLLSRKGYDVETSDNGIDALDMIESRYNMNGRKYDLLLIDLQMPVMDGLETVRRLRMKEAEKGKEVEGAVSPLQVICISADDTQETVSSAMSAGANEFMAKPFRINEFEKMFKKMREGQL